MECDFEQIYNNKIITKYNAVRLESRQLTEEGDQKIKLLYGSDTQVETFLIYKHDKNCYSSLDQLCLPWIDFVLEINQNISKSTGKSTVCPCLRHTQWINGSR